MIITNAKYWRIPDSTINGVTKTHPDSSIICDIDGQYYGVPIDEENTHYIEIKRQLDAGIITIAPSDGS
tara:strand:- start:172 stop:378 length:207 start_codon:yes stop_codon:yes gene_type:complete